MEWQPENEIDERLFRLIDPQQPLRSTDTFLPSVDYSILDIVWDAFLLFIFATGVIALSYDLIDKFLFVIHEEESKGLPIVVSVLLITAFCFGAFQTWRAWHSKLLRRRMLKNGRYRNGMFILDDAILLRSRPQILNIEKKHIRDIHIVIKGRGDPPVLLMTLQESDEDQRINVNISQLNLEQNAFTLKKSLIHWINTGTWEIQTALADFDIPKINT